MINLISITPRTAVLVVVMGMTFVTPLAQVNTVGPPNILWRNRANGENRVWRMSGPSFLSEVSIQARTDDKNWRIIGTGDFNLDGHDDILWQHETLDLNGIWYMQNLSLLSETLTSPSGTGDRSWQMVGVADFDRNGTPDILWHRQTGERKLAVWLMNNNAISEGILLSTWSADPLWDVVGVGYYNSDNIPDILHRHRTSGITAIWYMKGAKGTEYDTSALVTSGGQTYVNLDQDWKLVGALDIDNDNGLLPNGRQKPDDTLWRHSTSTLTDGDVAFHYMANNVLQGGLWARRELDPAWRIANQSMDDSVWRQASWSPRVSATVDSITTTLQIYSGCCITIQRRIPAETTVWTDLVTNWQGSSLQVSSVEGKLYEYQYFNSTGQEPKYRFYAGKSVPETTSRGKILLLVEGAIASSLAAELNTLERDLVGDGWKVIRNNTLPSHVDGANPWNINRTNVDSIKTNIIRSAYNAGGVKGVILVGHVPVPYSGSRASDGHTNDHRGAWVCDLYYGDMDNDHLWTDNSVNVGSGVYPDNVNTPGDGKSDQDYFPSNLELFVGRIDFANLTVFSSATTNLLKIYLNKNHAFRNRLPPHYNAPWGNHGIAFSTFPEPSTAGDFVRQNAIRNSAAFFGPSLNSTLYGDVFWQKTESALIAFRGGDGEFNAISAGHPAFQHTSLDLAQGRVSRCAFYVLTGSYFGDWNTGNNNFMRGVLAVPNFGLANVWSRFSDWRLEGLAMGRPLGDCLLETANNEPSQSWNRARETSLLGDPTLRSHYIAPPPSVWEDASQPGRVIVRWTGAENDSQYVVFRAATLSGDFVNLSQTLPSSARSFDDINPPSPRIYMVRAMKTTTTGVGSYKNLSQGTFSQ